MMAARQNGVNMLRWKLSDDDTIGGNTDSVDGWHGRCYVCEESVNLERFFDDEVETERRNRIRLSLAAYSYEFRDVSIMSDAEFDALSRKIDLTKSTENDMLDKFFREEFEPDTGMWIRKHPELDKLGLLYDRIKKRCGWES